MPGLCGITVNYYSTSCSPPSNESLQSTISLWYGVGLTVHAAAALGLVGPLLLLS